MIIYFISNRFTWHQVYFMENLKKYSEIKFLTTEEIQQDKKSRYPNYADYAYVEPYNKNYNLNECDFAILGSAPDKLISNRLKNNLLTFKYSERFYKNGFKKSKYIRNMLAAWLHHGRFQKYPIYMLCASAYTSYDCSRFNNYINRCYKWGYFPKTYNYDIEKLIINKKKKTILWTSRLIDWKHPEIPVKVAKMLKDDGYVFSLNMYGTGDMEQQIDQLINESGLEDFVKLCGAVTPDEIRKKMEESQIFIHTADFGEGWGAVINEAMNSGCAVVASHAVGSVPFLINDGENGLIFENENIDDLYKKVKFLLDNPQESDRIGKNAYKTISEVWNAEVAAERFIKLSEAIISGDKHPDLYKDGPCSKAEIIPDNWYIKK